MRNNWHPDCERVRAFLLANSVKDEATGCRVWTGELTNGYGRVMRKFFGLYLQKAHRVAWVERYGPIPKGQRICHTCDNRACIEDEHIYLGTDSSNMRDRAIRNPAKLTPEQVFAIRKDTRPPVTIAQAYNVSPRTIYSLRAGDRWSWLTKEAS